MSDMESKEHLTYLKIKEEYEDAKEKRLKYRRYGALFIGLILRKPCIKIIAFFNNRVEDSEIII